MPGWTNSLEAEQIDHHGYNALDELMSHSNRVA